jgi:hypothetical protein
MRLNGSIRILILALAAIVLSAEVQADDDARTGAINLSRDQLVWPTRLRATSTPSAPAIQMPRPKTMSLATLSLISDPAPRDAEQQHCDRTQPRHRVRTHRDLGRRARWR